MSIELNRYLIEEETYLKALILSRGVVFSKEALKVSVIENAKGQNLVYNMPQNATYNRPQELIIRNTYDDYAAVVSCVASNPTSDPILIDANQQGHLYAVVDGKILDRIDIHFVKEPEYYSTKLSNGENAKKYVSACGLDELNIIPWKGCAISKGCRFCGINNFINTDDLSAHRISKNFAEWENFSDNYLQCLEEAITIALKSDCYKEHAHVILIAGNLDNNNLDMETRIFAQIASRVNPLVKDASEEGIVVVITPSTDKKLMINLHESGVQKVVFNLEAITENGFNKYCPGKSDLGYGFFIERLRYAIDIFGKGNVWTNLVFGLEDKEDTLVKCKELIKEGIVISANVLHLDKGNSLDCNVPLVTDVIDFFYRLEVLNSEEGFIPFYCAKALRTSLSNEAHDCRIKEMKG